MFTVKIFEFEELLFKILGLYICDGSETMFSMSIHFSMTHSQYTTMKETHIGRSITVDVLDLYFDLGPLFDNSYIKTDVTILISRQQKWQQHGNWKL